MFKTRYNCRIDNSELKTVLNLGSIKVSNFVNTEGDYPAIPLELTVGKTSGLVQLRDTVDQDEMYRKYWYKSSLNSAMIKALEDIVQGIEKRIDLHNNDIVYDIGCNDGVLFTFYKKKVYRIGFDPANNLKETASKRCDLFINDYFKYDKHLEKGKVVTSIAMFYDLEDPNTFVQDVKKILDNDGIWVIQFTDLLSMFKLNAFDNIVHEHLEVYSLRVLKNLLEAHGLEVFDVEINNVNGGSLRAYIGYKNFREINPSVDLYQREEDRYMNSFPDPFKAFGLRVEKIRQMVTETIYMAKKNGKKIYALGASTKGNTTLQYFGLNTDLIDYVVDVNPDKWGKKTIGTNIPIISEKQADLNPPDYYLVLVWHFLEGLVEKYEDFFQSGGQFIVPMPEVKLINKSNKDEYKSSL